MSDETFPLPDQGILLTHLVVAEDPERTARFYSEGLGGELVFGEPFHSQ